MPSGGTWSQGAADTQIDLVRAAPRGDPQSLGLLLRIHYGAMYAVACGILLSSFPNGTTPALLNERWSPDVEIAWPTGDRLFGFSPLLAAFAADYADGVRYRLTNVVAGHGLTVVEHEFINPPEDPDHCPPGATWMLGESEGRIRSMRLFHAPRPRRDPEHVR